MFTLISKQGKLMTHRIGKMSIEEATAAGFDCRLHPYLLRKEEKMVQNIYNYIECLEKRITKLDERIDNIAGPAPDSEAEARILRIVVSDLKEVTSQRLSYWKELDDEDN